MFLKYNTADARGKPSCQPNTRATVEAIVLPIMLHCAYIRLNWLYGCIDSPMKLYLPRSKQNQTKRSGRMECVCTGLIWQTLTYYDWMSLFSIRLFWGSCVRYVFFLLFFSPHQTNVCLLNQNWRGKSHHNSFQICACLCVCGCVCSAISQYWSWAIKPLMVVCLQCYHWPLSGQR